MSKNSFHTFSTGVFNRTWEDALTEQKFYWIIALCLARWFGLTAYFANLSLEIGFNPDRLTALLVGLVIPIAWIFIAIKSNNRIISFIGYNMVVIPFWFTMWPIVDQYSPDVVRNAMWLTACITILMWWLWISYPNLFKKLWWILAIALLCLIVVWIAGIFIPWLNLTFFDYIGAWIFSLYIWYDMYRASSMQKTIDNAVDLCIDFYLDIINLFIELLKIMWRKN